MEMSRTLAARTANWAETIQPKRFKWYHAALFFAAVTVAAGLSARSSRQRSREQQHEDDQDFYRKQKLPVWAPPAGLFGPAWTLNTLCLTWAGLRLLNKPGWFPNRRALLLLQALHWLDFTTFGYVYFRRKSPILALVWTPADALLNTAAYTLARPYDRQLANAYLPVMAWTWFATSVAAYQALYNPDRGLGLEAPIQLWEGEKAPFEDEETAGEPQAHLSDYSSL